MDPASRGGGDHGDPLVPGRVLGIPEALRGLSRRLRARAWIAIGLALLAGAWANDATESRLRLEWERSHGPGLRVWRRALEAEGFGELTHEASYRRVARTLPSLAEPPGSVWRSPDGHWIAVFPRESDDAAPRVFGAAGILARIERGLVSRRNGRRRSSVPAELAPVFPAAWQPAGTGWPAFEDALDRASRTRVPELRREPDPRARPKSAAGTDPREIRY